MNGKIFPFLFEVERQKNKASVVGRMFIFCENTAEPKENRFIRSQQGSN